jgi:hypothetical protein
MGLAAMKLLVTKRVSSNTVPIFLFSRLNTNHRDFIGVSVQWIEILPDGIGRSSFWFVIIDFGC